MGIREGANLSVEGVLSSGVVATVEVLLPSGLAAMALLLVLFEP